MINTGKLAGRTIFITGASRGIGKAIAIKAARDGANIVIAAKTAEPHPKLSGTIFTAAKEIEDAGGKCLPCVVDIRYEDQVEKAVQDTVKKFGGIDILVNNASAISLTGTLETSMKKFDLMMGINTRGTYLCSRTCLPYLKSGTNPHILNLSPPLNMSARWFKDHVAYTMAKYGMSMCVLGMAEELKPDGIAVNALWPRTAIYTAAMEMIGGSKEVSAQCRKVDIMADAAYAMLTKDTSFTGNFCIDDEVLRDAGITDMDQYACVPGTNLLPDFFLDGEDPRELRDKLVAEGHTPKFGGSSEPSPADLFKTIEGLMNEELVQKMGGVFAFDLKGDRDELWYLDLKNKSGSIGQGDPPEGEVDCRMTMRSDDFVKMFTGKLKPTQAFMFGKLKISGNMALAMKLEGLMKKMNKSKL